MLKALFKTVAAALALMLVAIVASFGVIELDTFRWEKRLTAFAISIDAVPMRQIAGERWKKVFLLQSYDFTLPVLDELFEGEPMPWRFWWFGDASYATLVITWQDTSPTIVRLNRRTWRIDSLSKAWSTDREATLKVRPFNNLTQKDCRPTRPIDQPFCLKLE